MYWVAVSARDAAVIMAMESSFRALLHPEMYEADWV